MKRTIIIFVYVISLLLSSSLYSKENKPDRIIYLNLKLINGQVSLADYKIVEGKLKQSKTASFNHKDIYLKVINKENVQLFEAGIYDPSRLRYEYGNEEGQLENIRVVQDSVSFTVRMPYYPSIHEVQFFRIQKSPLRTSALMKLDQSMGSIILSPGMEDAKK